MEPITHSLNYELPQELHFDKYAQHILDNSRAHNLAETTTIALASSPSISTLDSSSLILSHPTTTSEFLQKLGATFIHSIQLQSLPKSNPFDTYLPSTQASATGVGMDMELGPHHLLMDSRMTGTAIDELQNQLNYDKFMNGIWIGVVMALILISMIFCFCSCFLYHQFRVWKRNYRTTVTETSDVEAVKLDLDIEDPVPEYTLVSGLPSYEAALDLLHKNPQSCLIVHPSVFEVFNKNEKPSPEISSIAASTPHAEAVQPLLNSESEQITENKYVLPSYNEVTSPSTAGPIVTLPYNHSVTSLLSLSPPKSQYKSKSTASSLPASEAEKQLKF